MGLNTEERQQVNFFTGYEVEHTVAYNMYTLFVVGIQPVEKILEYAKRENVFQIYFGTSQSFNPVDTTIETYQPWDDMIVSCLDAGYWVALDFDVSHLEGINDSGWCGYKNFIPMISVKMPHLNMLNYNATLKIDDTTWGATNPGVWTHKLSKLLDYDVFTHWGRYTQDTTIE